MPTKKSRARKKLVQLSKQKMFPLLRLPRELRDIIYRDAIAAGNLEILRTNKAVHGEASELLSQHAVFRMSFGFTTSKPVDLPRGAEGSIQRVECQLNMCSSAFYYDHDIITRFAGKDVIRESCVVTLDYGKDAMAAPASYRYIKLFSQLARLSGFKDLVVVIPLERSDFGEFESFLIEDQFDGNFPYGSRLLKHHWGNYERVRRFLERGLGPGKFHDSVEGHHLEFRPLDPFPKDWKPRLEDGY